MLDAEGFTRCADFVSKYPPNPNRGNRGPDGAGVPGKPGFGLLGWWSMLFECVLARAQLEIMRWCRLWMRPWLTRRKEAATGWLAVRDARSAAWVLSPSINSMQRGCKTGCAISKSGCPSVLPGCGSGHANR